MLALLAVVAVAVIVWRRDITWAYDRTRYLYVQHRCLTFDPPAQTIGYEEDVLRAARLWEDDGYSRVVDRNGNTAAALWWPREVKDWFAAMAWRPRQPPPALVFLHERTTPKGKRALVIATVTRPSGRPDWVGFQIDAMPRATWRPSRSYVAGLSSNLDKPPFDRDSATPRGTAPPLRVYAGRPHPTDPARFIVEYEAGGDRGYVEGWIVDDENDSIAVQWQVHAKPLGQP